MQCCALDFFRKWRSVMIPRFEFVSTETFQVERIRVNHLTETPPKVASLSFVCIVWVSIISERYFFYSFIDVILCFPPKKCLKCLEFKVTHNHHPSKMPNYLQELFLYKCFLVHSKCMYHHQRYYFQNRFYQFPMTGFPKCQMTLHKFSGHDSDHLVTLLLPRVLTSLLQLVTSKLSA